MIPGTKKNKVKIRLITNFLPSPLSRKTATGGNSIARIILSIIGSGFFE